MHFSPMLPEISFEKISAKADGSRWWTTGSGQISRTKSIRSCRCERRFHTVTHSSVGIGRLMCTYLHITTGHFKCVTESSHNRRFVTEQVAVALICSRFDFTSVLIFVLPHLFRDWFKRLWRHCCSRAPWKG